MKLNGEFVNFVTDLYIPPRNVGRIIRRFQNALLRRRLTIDDTFMGSISSFHYFIDEYLADDLLDYSREQVFIFVAQMSYLIATLSLRQFRYYHLSWKHYRLFVKRKISLSKNLYPDLGTLQVAAPKLPYYRREPSINPPILSPSLDDIEESSGLELEPQAGCEIPGIQEIVYRQISDVTIHSSLIDYFFVAMATAISVYYTFRNSSNRFEPQYGIEAPVHWCSKFYHFTRTVLTSSAFIQLRDAFRMLAIIDLSMRHYDNLREIYRKQPSGKSSFSSQSGIEEMTSGGSPPTGEISNQDDSVEQSVPSTQQGEGRPEQLSNAELIASLNMQFNGKTGVSQFFRLTSNTQPLKAGSGTSKNSRSASNANHFFGGR